jgi:hypothetical protein
MKERTEINWYGKSLPSLILMGLRKRKSPEEGRYLRIVLTSEGNKRNSIFFSLWYPSCFHHVQKASFLMYSIPTVTILSD